ncbi:SPOR domain-containing protein [Pseudomonas sp. MAP12]|uniref:SPOR domain-containing protein n=1 Tax=Geopseudomonas aromaticivorans TaxID=2849492 RepID=A0ABS6MXK2_9GAMM|nr:SPOR domain-containing protein [Pseudomonas aromaticivorans]MBV2133537.1 SPOR domain-containing protein [Pseudomonas aromaticivorans]
MTARKQKPKQRGASRTRSAPARKAVPGWIWLASGLVIGGFFVFLAQLEPGRDEIKRTPAGKPETATTTKPAQPVTPPKPKYDFYEELTKASPNPLPGSQPTPEQLQAAEAARAQALLEGRTPPPRLVMAPAAVPPAAAPGTPATPLAVAQPPKTAATATAATPASPKAAPAAPVKPPAPPPTPPAPATAAPSGRFYLQAGSFASRDQAESARAKLILLGQDARIESGKVGDKTWHRVVVGPFASRPQADSAKKQLGANGVGSVVQQRR